MSNIAINLQVLAQRQDNLQTVRQQTAGKLTHRQPNCQSIKSRCLNVQLMQLMQHMQNICKLSHTANLAALTLATHPLVCANCKYRLRRYIAQHHVTIHYRQATYCKLRATIEARNHTLHIALSHDCFSAFNNGLSNISRLLIVLRPLNTCLMCV